MATTQLEVVISAKDNFTGTANKISGSISRLGQAGKGVGQMASGLSRLGVVAAGVAAGGLIASAKAAMTWESAAAGMAKTIDLPRDQLKALGDDILAMSTKIPIGAVELAGLAETAGALGITGSANILAFTEATAKLGVTTNLSAQEAATSLGHVATILGLTGAEYEAFADTLVHLGNTGASTEQEIMMVVERIASSGSLIGLSTNEILAFSSAVANIGMEPFAAGGGLQRFFLEALDIVSGGGKKLKAMSGVAGVSGDMFADMFKSDPDKALNKFIIGLSKLSAAEQLAALNGLGFKDVIEKRMLLGLAKAEKETGNLTNAMNNAETASGKMGEEAAKRFGTLASKVGVLKNGLFLAALEIGEGLTPAIGRMADKLGKLLSDPKVRGDLRKIGQDIGRMIDGIDWKGVLDGARTFMGLMKTVLGIIKMLPTEVKIAGAAIIGLGNTPIIGGALKDVVGGALKIGGAVAGGAAGLGGKAGALGKLFAQPVFVTNWPIGMGGIGGAAGKAGGMGLLAGAGILGFLGAAMVGAAGIAGPSVRRFTGTPEGGHMKPTGPITVGLASDAARAHAAMTRAVAPVAKKQDRANIWLGQLARVGERQGVKLAAVGLAVQRKGEQTVGSVNRNVSATNSARNAIERKRLEVKIGPTIVTVNTYVTANSVTRTQTTSKRYSPDRSYMVGGTAPGRPGGGR